MRILLVEDDPTTAKSIEMMLTHANLNVYWTDLGEEAIDLAKLYDYDLLLLDLNLPDMDGHDVLRHLRMARDRNTYSNFVRVRRHQQQIKRFRLRCR